MNNELIEQIDYCLKYHHMPPLLRDVLNSCKAALTQQQEAEPVACGGTFISVPVDAIDWLKEKFPDLCIKAGLCKRIAGRLYTRTTMDAHPPKPAAQCNDQGCPAHYATSPQVPEGFQLVPILPTEAMIAKGTHANSEWLNDNAPIGESRYREPAISVYKAMLSAAKEEN